MCQLFARISVQRGLRDVASRTEQLLQTREQIRSCTIRAGRATLTGLRTLGMVTPIGGLAWIAGWLLLAYYFVAQRAAL